MSSLKQR